jgi:hypothetical protein
MNLKSGQLVIQSQGKYRVFAPAGIDRAQSRGGGNRSKSPFFRYFHLEITGATPKWRPNP